MAGIVRLDHIVEAIAVEVGEAQPVVAALGIANEVIPLFDQLVPASMRDAPIGSIYEWRADNLALALGRRLVRQGGVAVAIIAIVAGVALHRPPSVVGHAKGTRMSRSSSSDGSPRPSRLLVVSQSASPDGSTATVRMRPNSPSSSDSG